jgi:hypothetical protein
MRKIGTEKEIERKKKRNTIIISIFMLGVLIVGTVGYGLVYNQGNSDNGQQNTVADNAVSIGNQLFYLSHSRTEVAEIPVTISKNIESYSNLPLYISSSNQGVIIELASTIGRYSWRVQEACFGSCEQDLPEKTCTDNLIIWEESEFNNVYQEQNCIFIEGDTRAVDAFIYNILDTN